MESILQEKETLRFVDKTTIGFRITILETVPAEVKYLLKTVRQLKRYQLKRINLRPATLPDFSDTPEIRLTRHLYKDAAAVDEKYIECLFGCSSSDIWILFWRKPDNDNESASEFHFPLYIPILYSCARNPVHPLKIYAIILTSDFLSCFREGLRGSIDCSIIPRGISGVSHQIQQSLRKIVLALLCQLPFLLSLQSLGGLNSHGTTPVVARIGFDKANVS
ncbi:hypothetical protein FF38_00564 [Lucilia cuprina]|uniref:Uncharacterized protein n=1 Tax=Lucilia cuprina TaxID=7375 RepID=A0A0L0CFS5_LUCCU|nr:hypothetical protein FF38_00564 [Lucilia cuprina]